MLYNCVCATVIIRNRVFLCTACNNAHCAAALIRRDSPGARARVAGPSLLTRRSYFTSHPIIDPRNDWIVTIINVALIRFCHRIMMRVEIFLDNEIVT